MDDGYAVSMRYSLLQFNEFISSHQNDSIYVDTNLKPVNVLVQLNQYRYKTIFRLLEA